MKNATFKLGMLGRTTYVWQKWSGASEPVASCDVGSTLIWCNTNEYDLWIWVILGTLWSLIHWKCTMFEPGSSRNPFYENKIKWENRIHSCWGATISYSVHVLGQPVVWHISFKMAHTFRYSYCVRVCMTYSYNDMAYFLLLCFKCSFRFF